MTTTFAHLTLEEMYQDWKDSHTDIHDCETALSLGVTHYYNGTKSVQERLDANKNIIGVIEQEVKDRGLTLEELHWVKP